ncbi:MAG: preprotein translocase subunit SecA [Armatimonadota bacterium]
MATVPYLVKRVFDPNEREVVRLRRRADEITALEPEIQALSDKQLAAKTDEFRERLAAGETLDDLLNEAFAVVREAAIRTLGQRPFDVQVMGGIVLHQGKIAEMKTGEGKTLTATMPLYLNALTGKGAHLVTTNDYLVKWQSEWMGQIFRFLGLSVGYIQHDMDAPERRESYLCDITYVNNSELGFDYLRDNMAVHPDHLVLRDLHYAIVDEVDSILVDEARTPLIISGMPEKSSRLYERVSEVVTGLVGGDEKQHKAAEEAGSSECDHWEYTVDEKGRNASLTERGVSRVERALGIDDLSSPQNLEIAHLVNAALKANYIFKRDVDYVVKDGEVIIVDEFTGRLQPGRRYSDGLHQAIEAKEGVRVEMERQTVASITYQNFFRLYDKLAGMTGTAKTEEPEFLKIYNMPVTVIPTNRPMIRVDQPDVVYKTEEAKFRGIVSEILRLHARGQPVLVGTRSIEVSEMLSERLAPEPLQLAALATLLQGEIQHNANGLDREKRDKYVELLRTPIPQLQRSQLRPVTRDLGIEMNLGADHNLAAVGRILGVETEHLARLQHALENGIPHNVLNAKYHEQEAQIIAEAGRPGAVTIATNMAGRGVDIMLGGKPAEGEEVAPDYEKVKQAGGLYVLGTERHESRRIDNQLRGRSGRQGDPGESRFFISLEDELMRLFGPERFGRLLASWPEEEAVENRMVTRSIESAQKKVEMRNFEIRKHTLKYDDVMNTQRALIYEQRQKVLMGADITNTVRDMLDRTVAHVVKQYADPQIHPTDWELPAMYDLLCQTIPGIEERLTLEDVQAFENDEITERVEQVVHDMYDQREREIGPELLRDIERSVLLRVIGMRWMNHLQEMDYLREAVHLRAYGQQDPLIAYQKESYDYFQALLRSMAEDVVRLLFTVEVAVEQRQHAEDMQEGRGAHVEAEDEGARKPFVAAKQPRRNDPCPCGSGRKYKKCCMPV